MLEGLWLQRSNAVTLMIYTTVSMLQGAQMKERVNHLISR
jgi:hypothetical protein